MDDLVVRTAVGDRYLVYLGGVATDAQEPIESELTLAPVSDPFNPTRLAFADLTGDAHTDLIGLVFEPTPGIAVLHGDGAGGFADTTFIPTFDVPNDVIAADFTNDGLTDLVVTNTQLATFQFYRGLPGGGVAEPVNTNFGSGVDGLVAHDFDEDGNLDLACIHTLRGTEFENTLSLLQGDGDGGFAEVRRLDLGGIAGFPVSVSDFDDDGRVDLLTTRSTNDQGEPAGLLFLSGIGGFEFAAPQLVEAAGVRAIVDADNDGMSDVVLSAFRPTLSSQGETGVAVRFGGASFLDPAPSRFIALQSVAFDASVVSFDSDGDGMRDLLVGSSLLFSQDVSIARAVEPRRFVSFIGLGLDDPGQLFVADVNGDTFEDVVFTDNLNNQPVAGVVLAEGTFEFAEPVLTPLFENGTVADIGDFNGDGRVDLVTADSFGSPPYYVLYSLGDRLAVPVEFSTAESARFAVGDLDGDGFDDVLLITLNGPALAHFGSPSGLSEAIEQQFTLSRTLLLANPAVADLDDDGRGDLIVPVREGIRVYLATDQRGVYDLVASQGPFQFSRNDQGRVALGDIDGDGRLDAAYISGFGVGNLCLAFGAGNGVFAGIETNPLIVGDDDASLHVADLNADGRADIVLGTDVFLGDGAGGFAPSSSSSSDGSAALLDVDGDGRLDLVNGRGLFLNQCRAPLCPADLTSDAAGPPDGLVTLSDFARYLDLWSAGEPAADITATNVCLPGQTDGRVDLSDFACYLRFWASGCP